MCPGINDTDEELAALAEYLKELSPDKVQINTLDRPGTESWVKSLDAEGLKKVLIFFKGLPVEVVSRKLQAGDMSRAKGLFPSGEVAQPNTKNNFDIVLKTMKRRPLTLNDITSMTGYSQQEIKKWISDNIKSSVLVEEITGNEIFYRHK